MAVGLRGRGMVAFSFHTYRFCWGLSWALCCYISKKSTAVLKKHELWGSGLEPIVS